MPREFNHVRMMSVSLIVALTIGTAGIVAAQRTAKPSMIPTSVTSSDTSAIFSNVDVAQDGYLVIHEIIDGGVIYASTLGWAKLMPGMNENVMVTLDVPLVSGKTYVGQVYSETNGSGIFEGGVNLVGIDAPARANGREILFPFTAG